MTSPPNRTAPDRWRRALGAVRPHRAPALVVIALSLTSAAFGAFEPLLYKRIFDGLGTGVGAFDAVLPYALLLGGVALLREVMVGFASCLTWRTRLRLQHRLLDQTVTRLHRLPMEYHRGEGIGAVMTKLDRGIQGFVAAFGDTITSLVPAFAYLAMSIVVMSRLSWRLTVVTLLLVPLPALLASIAAPKQVKREARLLERWSRLYARFHEVLSGLVTVRSFGMEDRERRRFLDGVEEANREVERGVGFDTRIGALQSAVVTGARVVGIGYGAYLVVQGQTTVGTVVAFLGYVGGLFGPVQSLAGLYGTVRKAAVSVDTVFGILDAETTVEDRPDAIDPGRLVGDVRFESVRFGYEAGKAPVLDGLSLHVRAGETVALVGPSGSGKTTITSLIQRFHDPQAGVVRIDGRDVRTLQQAALRREIGVVLQDPVLFNDTVAHNITYGRPDATPAQIEAAARAAHAHEFILGLPQGYDTVLGERGGRLSVGERQRISIARALVKDPPLVILDEATSALDAETEAVIQEALERLLRGRTGIVIAHRLATVVRADRIVVLRHGAIVEEGTHERLVAQRGYYAKLVHEQTRGLLPDHLTATTLH
jgi:ATP-binding cassette subfamily B protein